MKGQAETPKLLDQVRNVLRLHHYSIHTERSYVDWIIETAMIYTHVIQQGGQGVPSPLDDLP
jgi:hypothetical protein